MAVVVNVVLLPALVGVVADELSDGPEVIAGLNFHPELPDTLVELVPGFQVAPPVAVESLTER